MSYLDKLTNPETPRSWFWLEISRTRKRADDTHKDADTRDYWRMRHDQTVRELNRRYAEEGHPPYQPRP